MNAPAIAALRRERAVYVNRGLDDRVAAVDAELDRLGAPETAVAAAAPERAIPPAPRQRRPRTR